MKVLQVLGCILVCLLGTGSFLHAQQAVLSTGGEAAGADGTVSYSVGQLAYTASSDDNNFSVAAGVQQAFELDVMVGTSDADIDLHIAVYPNPTSDWLQLDLSEVDYRSFGYCLYQQSGQLLREALSLEATTLIPLANYPTGTYILTIVDRETTIKSFQIIKK